MIELAAGSVVGPISLVCERRQDGRQRIGVADVEGAPRLAARSMNQRDQKLLPAPPEPIGKISLGR